MGPPGDGRPVSTHPAAQSGNHPGDVTTSAGPARPGGPWWHQARRAGGASAGGPKLPGHASLSATDIDRCGATDIGRCRDNRESIVNRVLRNQTRRHFAVILLVLAGLLGAAGCVNVPTTGPIERVEGQQPACQNCVNVVVAPPAPGDEPRQIVEGFLRATSNYQPNYSVAKQFLTRMAAETWSPDEGVSIYQGSVSATGETTVKLDGRFVGSLVKDRTYKALDHEMNVEYNLRQEDGEWRIENPPPGLFVTEFSFDSFYRPYDLYF